MKTIALVLIWIMTTGCAFADGEKSTEKQDQPIAFTGHVVFNDFEGGFYGVVTDDHRRLLGDIPDALKKDNLSVRGLYRLKPPRVGFRMWGSPVEFVEIRPADR